MHPQLVRSTSDRLEREPTNFRFPRSGRRKGAQHFPLRHRRLAVGVVFHPPAARFVEAAQRKFDGSLIGGGRAFDHRPIGLLDRAGFEQPAEQRQRLAMASEHQAAGGVAIEPVRKRRRSRQPEAQRVEMILKALATLGAAMDREAGRLVDHQHEPVAVEEARHHLFGGHVPTLPKPLSRAPQGRQQHRYE